MTSFEKFLTFSSKRTKSVQIDIEGSEYPCYTYPDGTDILYYFDEEEDTNIYFTSDGKKFFFLELAEFNQFILVDKMFHLDDLPTGQQ